MEVNLAASDILSLVAETRKRGWFSQEESELLRALEYCILNYRFEREERQTFKDAREEYVHLLTICNQNCTAYLVGLQSGHFHFDGLSHS